MASVEEVNARWNAFVTDVTTRLARLEGRVTKLESAPQDQMNRIEIDSLRLRLEQFKTWLLRWAADQEVELGLKAARLGPIGSEQPVADAPEQPAEGGRQEQPPVPELPLKKTRLSGKVVAAVCSVVIVLGVAGGLAILYHWIPGLP